MTTFMCLKNVGTDRYSVLEEVALETNHRNGSLMVLTMDNKLKEHREGCWGMMADILVTAKPTDIERETKS